jgi:hypothetical protein
MSPCTWHDHGIAAEQVTGPQQISRQARRCICRTRQSMQSMQLAHAVHKRTRQQIQSWMQSHMSVSDRSKAIGAKGITQLAHQCTACNNSTVTVFHQSAKRALHQDDAPATVTHQSPNIALHQGNATAAVTVSLKCACDSICASCQDSNTLLHLVHNSHWRLGTCAPYRGHPCTAV